MSLPIDNTNELTQTNREMLAQVVEDLQAIFLIRGLDRLRVVPLLYGDVIEGQAQNLTEFIIQVAAEEVLEEAARDIGTCREAVASLGLQITSTANKSSNYRYATDEEGSDYYITQKRIKSYEDIRDDLQGFLRLVVNQYGLEDPELPAVLRATMTEAVEIIVFEIAEYLQNAYLQYLLAEADLATPIREVFLCLQGESLYVNVVSDYNSLPAPAARDFYIYNYDHVRNVIAQLANTLAEEEVIITDYQ
jgi:hypothetical protein